MNLILGLGYMVYAEMQGEPTFQIKAQHGDAYVALQYEAPRIEELGQGLMRPDIYTLSVGYESKIGSVIPFVEVGYSYIDGETKAGVQTEVVYTHLVGNHYVEGTRVPTNGVPNLGETNGVHTNYKLDSGISGSIGVRFPIDNHWSASASYRFLKVHENWKLWDDQIVSTTGGWWQENTTRDLSGFEVKINYQF